VSDWQAEAARASDSHPFKQKEQQRSCLLLSEAARFPNKEKYQQLQPEEALSREGRTQRRVQEPG
jgi:hypothetical protein